jgi:hypothetical protein
MKTKIFQGVERLQKRYFKILHLKNFTKYFLKQNPSYRKHGSMSQMEPFDEKIWRYKIWWYYPLKYFLLKSMFKG